MINVSHVHACQPSHSMSYDLHVGVSHRANNFITTWYLYNNNNNNNNNNNKTFLSNVCVCKVIKSQDSRVVSLSNEILIMT